MALTIQQIQDNITAKNDSREIINQLADYIQANPSGGSSYLEYTALLSQSGTNAPTIESNGTGLNTPLENTIGAIVWSFVDTGAFRGILPDAFPDENKTFITFGNADNKNPPAALIGYWVDSDTIEIDQVKADGTFVNGFFKIPIKIRVYP